jgi:CreA protein
MKKILLACSLLAATAAQAQVLGSVTTEWNALGANHKIEVSVFDDPKVQGSACFLSKPVTGGITGSLGLAEDKSDVSIACRAVGPLSIVAKFSPGEQVFTESRSPMFKKLRVVRFYDAQRQVIVYLAYSDKLIDGSPKNSISVVPFR